jgi:serine/threonine protein kinase
MTEFSANTMQESAVQMDSTLHARIDALQRGDCTEDDFLREILTLRKSAPNLVWTILALIDRRYRAGQLPGDLFRSIKSKFARHELEERDDGTTVELHPAIVSASRVTEHVAHLEIAAAGAAPDADYANQIDRTQDVARLANVPAALQNATSMNPTESNSVPQVRDIDRVLGNRYALGNVLGRGGMGTVFRALDRHRVDLPEKNRHVALKVLDESIRRRPEILADLQREFYCAQALAHPNIVKVYEMHHDEDIAFYTMELLEGQLLSNVLERVHPHPLERPYAWAIIRDVGAALAHAHSRNVVHGDLKPQNIMITEGGEVRILDFGASGTSTRQWTTSDPLQRNRVPPVTLAYACCELLDGQQTDPRDDLFALACLSCELLAGEHPFERRRSTEARELGMQPRRPVRLTDRQWRALQLGLSWRRESRSLSVRDWLAMLGLEPAAERLPPLHAPGSVAVHSWQQHAVRPASLLIALIAGLGLWAAFHHAKSESRFVGKPVASQAQLNLPRSPPPTASNQIAVSDTDTLPQPTPIGFGVQPSLQPLEVAAAASREEPLSESVGRGTAALESRPPTADQISLSADTYRVPSGEHFAEINVRRSDEPRGNSSFVWWTEASSARPGSDFVPQERTTQLFLKRRHSAKLFIRIVPNPSRRHTEMFYVNIGEPSAGYSLGPVTRAAILIPPPTLERDSKSVDSTQRQP